jgi:hypothetical protein
MALKNITVCSFQCLSSQTMDEIRSIGKKSCDLKCDYAAKLRQISTPTDFTLWLQTFNLDNPHLRAKITYSHPLARLTASCDEKSCSFSATPLPWLTFSVHPTAKSLNPQLELSEKFAISADLDASGQITFPFTASLPRIDVACEYRNPYFRARAAPCLTDQDGRFRIDGSATLSLAHQWICADMIFEATGTELFQGAKLKFRNFQAGLLSTSSEKGGLFFECNIGRLCVGVQSSQIFQNVRSMWKVFSSTSLGLRYSFPGGYVGGAWQVPKLICAKAKASVGARVDVAATMRVDNYDFAKAAFCLSVCVNPDPQPAE